MVTIYGSIIKQYSDEYKISEFKKMLFGVCFCGVVYKEDTGGELRNRLVKDYVVFTVNFSELNTILFYY
jgi:hypothetical protein